jgi:hypothetical protein
MRRALAFLAIVFYALNALVYLSRGEPYHLLWGCHLAVLLVAAGLLIRSASLNAIGLMWSVFGLPFWLIYIFTDGEFTPTAALTHLGGIVIGIYGIRLLGMPRGSAGKALAAYLGLWALTRLVTPESANVNLAFHVWPGWEDRFPSYPIYLATLLVSGVLTFAITESFFRRIRGASERTRARLASGAGRGAPASEPVEGFRGAKPPG